MQGSCSQRLEGVRAALEARLGSGEELGASIYVDLDGDCHAAAASADNTRATERAFPCPFNAPSSARRQPGVLAIDLAALAPESPMFRTFTGPAPGRRRRSS